MMERLRTATETYTGQEGGGPTAPKTDTHPAIVAEMKHSSMYFAERHGVFVYLPPLESLRAHFVTSIVERTQQEKQRPGGGGIVLKTKPMQTTRDR